MVAEIDYRSVGHIIPGLVTFMIGLAWIYNTNYDYMLFERESSNSNKTGRNKPRFETRICSGSLFNFKNRFLKIFNVSDAFIGLVLGICGVLLFVMLTK
jgi:hypothetical protein